MLAVCTRHPQPAQNLRRRQSRPSIRIPRPTPVPKIAAQLIEILGCLNGSRVRWAKIEKQYGKAKRTWVMDRGIPTEEVLAEMRNSKTPIHYLVGSPRGRLTRLEKAFLTKPWEDVRESVRVKLIEHGEETYVFVRSEGRRDKEQSMRRRRLKKLIKRLRELQQQNLTRDELLLKLGAARKEAGKAYALLIIHMPTKDQPVTSETFHFALDRKKLR